MDDGVGFEEEGAGGDEGVVGAGELVAVLDPGAELLVGFGHDGGEFGGGDGEAVGVGFLGEGEGEGGGHIKAKGKRQKVKGGMGRYATWCRILRVRRL